MEKVDYDVFKLNYSEIENQYKKKYKVYLNTLNEETISSYRQIQVNSLKFINYFIINVKSPDILKTLERLKIPVPNLVISNKYEQQLFYKLTTPLNLSNTKVKSYYNAIFSSMLKQLKVEKNNENLSMKNYFNTKLYETLEIHSNSYVLEEFRHLIIKDHVLSFKKNRYDFINNYIFNYVSTYSLKHLYLIFRKGKVVVENKGFEVARALEKEGQLKDFSTDDLHKIIDKIYNYIVENKETLTQKYGNRGRYVDCVSKYKSLKKKQQMSGKLSAKANSRYKEFLTHKTVRELLEINGKITVKGICEKSGLSNTTVIKYYKRFKDEIKGHNLKVKEFNKELDALLRGCF